MNVKLTRLPNDPLCARVSIGGTKEIGYYCVIRLAKGQTQADIAEMVQAIGVSLERAPRLSVHHDQPVIGQS